jgi:hypothetical protein
MRRETTGYRKEKTMSETLTIELDGIEDALFGDAGIIPRSESDPDSYCYCTCSCTDGPTKVSNAQLTRTALAVGK